MNVDKIQELSELHAALKKFRGVCIFADVTLKAARHVVVTYDSVAELPRAATKLVLPALRKALFEQIEKLEKAIVREATPEI